MKKVIIFVVAALLVSSCIWKHHSKSRLRPLPVANEEVGVKYFNTVSIAWRRGRGLYPGNPQLREV